MKYSTAKEHRDFFQKNQWIEFEGLLTKEQLAEVNQAIDDVLAERLKVTIRSLTTLSHERQYLHGHDLWRSSAAVKKIVTSSRLAEIVSELVETKPLRLGCDQLFPSFYEAKFEKEETHYYSDFLKQQNTLQATTCFQGVLCGLMISLEGEVPRDEMVASSTHVFPAKAGNGIFFRPDLLIDWSFLLHSFGRRYYLIVYTQASSHYILEPRDPHTHLLKRLGYVFNDKLSDKLHPIIYR